MFSFKIISSEDLFPRWADIDTQWIQTDGVVFTSPLIDTEKDLQINQNQIIKIADSGNLIRIYSAEQP